MPHKLCSSCHQASYSASSSGIWLCPYCGKELTLDKAWPDASKLPSPPPSSSQFGQLHIFPAKVSQTSKPR